MRFGGRLFLRIFSHDTKTKRCVCKHSNPVFPPICGHAPNIFILSKVMQCAGSHALFFISEIINSLLISKKWLLWAFYRAVSLIDGRSQFIKQSKWSCKWKPQFGFMRNPAFIVIRSEHIIFKWSFKILACVLKAWGRIWFAYLSLLLMHCVNSQITHEERLTA